jgi:hypothetical protein
VEHGRLADRSVDQVGPAAVHIAGGHDVDLDRAGCLVGERAGQRAVQRLAADHDHLVDPEDRPGRSDGMVEFGRVHLITGSLSFRRNVV